MQPTRATFSMYISALLSEQVFNFGSKNREELLNQNTPYIALSLCIESSSMFSQQPHPPSSQGDVSHVRVMNVEATKI